MHSCEGRPTYVTINNPASRTRNLGEECIEIRRIRGGQHVRAITNRDEAIAHEESHCSANVGELQHAAALLLITLIVLRSGGELGRGHVQQRAKVGIRQQRCVGVHI
jgi:hypothetical protein